MENRNKKFDSVKYRRETFNVELRRKRNLELLNIKRQKTLEKQGMGKINCFSAQDIKDDHSKKLHKINEAV